MTLQPPGRPRFWQVIALAGMLGLMAGCQATTGQAVYPKSFQQTAADEAAQRVVEVVARAVDEIAAYYIDDVDQEDLRRRAAAYMVTGMARGEGERELKRGAVNAMLESLAGDNGVIPLHEAGGPGSAGNGAVGISEAQMEDGSWVITRVHPLGGLAGTPVRPGWRLIEIDGTARQSMDREDVFVRLRGEIGTQVSLVFEDQRGLRHQLKALRVAHSAMLSVVSECNEFGLVRLFRLTTLTDALLREFLRECGPERLVLDLRGNAGGTLDGLVETAALFVGDAPVYRLRERGGSHERRSEGSRPIYDGQLLVLTDRHTASAGAVLAGALRLHSRAIVVGQATAGHRVVHTIEHLADDIYMRLVTGRFENADGSSPVPVEPDITVVDVLATDEDEVLQAVPALLARLAG